MRLHSAFHFSASGKRKSKQPTRFKRDRSEEKEERNGECIAQHEHIFALFIILRRRAVFHFHGIVIVGIIFRRKMCAHIFLFARSVPFSSSTFSFLSPFWPLPATLASESLLQRRALFARAAPTMLSRMFALIKIDDVRTHTLRLVSLRRSLNLNQNCMSNKKPRGARAARKLASALHLAECTAI